MHDMSEKKWKDALLKSSLPLEHAVAAQLARLKWLVWGQFSYARNNESGTTVDFSVDLEASKEYSTDTHWLASLQILIECKYTTPGAKWLFLPYPPTAQIMGNAVSVFDQAANKRVTDRRALHQLEDDAPYCIRGVSIFDNGTDEIAIHRGTSQLRYAMPHLASAALSSQATDMHDSDINVTVACAILVTTAPLFTLNDEVTIEDVQSAETIDPLITEVESVILWDSRSPDRHAYAQKLIDQIELVGMKARINRYAEVFQPTEKMKYPPADYQPARALFEAGDHVFVVSLKNLESFLKRLDKASARTAKSIQHIATVEYDKETSKVIIGPYPRLDTA
jgi:hypothetical protein